MTRIGNIAALCLAATIAACSRSPTKPLTLEPQTKSGFMLLSQPPDERVLESLTVELQREPENPAHLRDTGMIYLILSRPDRWDYVEQAIHHLEKALETDSADPQTLIYLGLSRAARAKNPKTPLFEKLSNAKKGFALMDEALALDAENPSLRLLRAKAQLLAPPLLGRKQALTEDTGWLSQFMASNQKNIPEHLTVLIHIFLGDYQFRILEDLAAARDHWEQASIIHSPYAKEARDRLAGNIPSF